MGCCCSSSRKVSSVKPNSRSFPESEEFEGPVKNRECTDTFFLFIFIVYLIFLLVGVGMASLNGDPKRLWYGYDDYGNLCGIKNTQIKGANRSGMDYTGLRYVKVSEECSGEDCRTQKQCQNKCPEGYENTTFNRCFPKAVTKTTLKIYQTALPFLEEVGSDISLCWREMVLLCLISIGLSVLLLILFRFCASFIIWVVLIVVTITSIAVTAYIWYMWNDKKKKLEEYEGPNKDLRQKRVTYWLIAGVISTIFTISTRLLLQRQNYLNGKRESEKILVDTHLRKSSPGNLSPGYNFHERQDKVGHLILGNAAAVFQEAGKSIAAMPLILLQPVLTFISLVAVCCFLILGFICLQTSGKPLVDSEGRVTFPIELFFQVMRWLSLFGFIWLTQFMFACQDLVVAGAIAKWYFTRDKNRLGSPIWGSFSNLVCYHLGSAAFGSLIIAIMKAIRALFRLLQKYLNEQNQRCEIFWKIFQCCLSCFESYLKFLSKNAYIMIVIYGEPFCTSARRSFESLASNILRLVAVDCIGDFILFVGKMGVTISVAFIALEILKNVEGLHYIWAPVSISCVFAFLCCHCFLSIYEMAIDTLLLCFCEDCRMNDGATRPYFMNRSLMVLVEGSRKNSRVKSVSSRKPIGSR